MFFDYIDNDYLQKGDDWHTEEPQHPDLSILIKDKRNFLIEEQNNN